MLDEAKTELEAELASISVVTSEDIVEASNSTARLSRIQDKLDDTRSAINVTKQILSDLKDHELTPELALMIDKTLEGPLDYLDDGTIRKDLEEVGGLENLGFTLLPSQFIASRLAGCEDLLGKVKSSITSINTRISRFFKEGLNALFLSREKLSKELDEVEEMLKNTNLGSGNDILIPLGNRLFNLFQTNGRFNELSLTTDLDRTSRAMKALFSFYNVENKKVQNALLKYFGEFEGLGAGKGLNLLFQMDKRIPTINFKEANIKAEGPNSETYTYRKSKSLMGGYYFLDKRLHLKFDLRSYEDVDRYYKLRMEDKLTLVREDTIHIKEGDDKYKPLTKDKIQSLIKNIRVTIKDWEKSILTNEEKQTLFNNFLRTMEAANLNREFDNTFKELAFFSFLMILERTERERINLEIDVNRYLINLYSGVIDYIKASIKAREVR